MSFTYKNDTLYCESVSVPRIIKEHGTPCYIYSYTALIQQLNSIRKAFAPVNPLICFAMKANDNSAVVKTLVDQGAGCDIVSGGELIKALKCRADPGTIVFASVGKTDEEILAAIKAKILFFNVESQAELKRIDLLASQLGVRPGIALRINPDVAAVTHDRITTGTLEKKFGIDLATARDILVNQERYPSLDFSGLHMHIGSQITSVEPYIQAMKRVLAFLDDLTRAEVYLRYFDLGGGFGIDYDGQTSCPIEGFAAPLIPLLEETGLNIILEPGRFLCGNAGIFITRTLYLKDNGVKKFLIVDAGMNDLPRPSLYGAYHAITPVRQTRGPTDTFDVVGPICESGDFFAKDRVLPVVRQGDLLAIHSAGAYCHVMASNYNARGRAPEIMVKGNRWAVIKQRETLKDITRGEAIPDFL